MDERVGHHPPRVRRTRVHAALARVRRRRLRARLRMVAHSPRAPPEPGTGGDAGGRRGDPGGRPGLPGPPVPHHVALHPGAHGRALFPLPPDLLESGPRRRRGPGLPVRVPGQFRGRVRRHDPRRPRERPHGLRGDPQLQGSAGNGLPGRDRLRDVRGGPGTPGRHGDLRALPRRRVPGPDRLRVRRVPRRLVHADRRRHLHQGGRRWGRPRGQGRGGDPRGRPPERGDDRRQRRRQRRGLRGDGRGRLRVVRGHAGGGDYPGRRHAARPAVPRPLRQSRLGVRAEADPLPAAGPGDRRVRLDPRHPVRPGQG